MPIYTNYEPTPTPIPPGNTFKRYQHIEESVTMQDAANDALQSWQLPPLDVPVATEQTLGKSLIALRKINGFSDPHAQSVYAQRTHKYTVSATTITQVTQGFSGGGGAGSTGTISNADDATGPSIKLTGNELAGANVNTHSVSWGTGQCQSRYGIYIYNRFLLPSSMAALLTNRTFVALNLSTDPSIHVSAETGTATWTGVIIHWRQGLNGTWAIVAADGSNYDTTYSGVTVARDTLYSIRIAAVDGVWYYSINGPWNKILNAKLPSSSANMTAARFGYGRNNAAVTGDGNLVIQVYGGGLLLP